MKRAMTKKKRNLYNRAYQMGVMAAFAEIAALQEEITEEVSEAMDGFCLTESEKSTVKLWAGLLEDDPEEE